MYTYLILCTLAVLSAANPLPPELNIDNGRIVGGVHVSIEAYPYQVTIQYAGQHFCGGVIYDANHILTAGHCAQYLTYPRILVIAGTGDINRGGSAHSIVSVTRHEDYYLENKAIPRNDIAVAKVYPPFQLDERRAPIGLLYSEEGLQAGVKSVVTGFGYTSEHGQVSRDLMAVEVPIIDRQECSEIYKELGTSGVHEDSICAGYTEGGKDSCQGDSGGPLAVNGKLAGIVSYGFGCARPNVPGVYTNIAYFTKWIADNTA